MSTYNILLSSDDATVVSEYIPQGKRSEAYQSEAALERAFVQCLVEQGYEALEVRSEKGLIENLRTCLEELNGILFTDGEWEDFFANNLANKQEGIVEKTRKIQEDFIQVLKREDGSSQNIKLIDKAQIHNNRLQVMHQYTEKGADHEARYDVTILVNGLPLVHVELKRRGVAIKEAFNQINRYQRESFWAGCGLYEYVQVFVISNGTHTKYYSNTTRDGHIKNTTSGKARKRKTSNSFEFTSFWADGNNRILPDLVDFTKTFFAKHTLLNILTRYCVFTSESLLLVMRPYQIVATERILNRIEIATNYKRVGTLEAGGYIWHTTGSGKTLTSFKTAQLASRLKEVEKVLFVVDRKDLDYQTIREYDRFEKGAANSNANTSILQRQLEDTTSKILVTTIQKLSIFVAKNKTHPVYMKHVVIIFDECHRSQFGQMHVDIVRHFKRYHIFGFTGTPIFAKNAGSGGMLNLRTTEQAFGEKLHTYTIVDAINDGNVLPFRIDYINTIKQKETGVDKSVSAIDTEEALGAPERIRAVVQYLLEHFDQKTIRNVHYTLKGKRVAGFNAMFAVSSIPMCKKYYLELKKQLAEQGRALTVATIFSFAPNEADPLDGILEDESFDTEALEQSSREFLDRAIEDYNATFQTNFDSSSKGFQDYYKDLSRRVKEREVDLLLVVNMFLTGFDATTLNTLWVDKNLKMHGLLQAFSRTNRILNSVKTFGNIVCFRNLEKETNDAIALFGNKEAHGIVLLKSYEDYYHGFTDDRGHYQKGYEERIEELLARFPLGEQILGEEAEKAFIVLFGNILRLRNILSAFDRFKGEELLSAIDLQDYTGRYHDLHDKYKPKPGEKASILDDVVFEMELVKQVEVNIDYILMLVKAFQGSNCKNKTILTEIDKAIKASLQLRSKQELIQNFIKTINTDTDIQSDWIAFVRRQQRQEMEELIHNEKLLAHPTTAFFEQAFRNGELHLAGTSVDCLMPAMSLFAGNRQKKKAQLIEKLRAFFEKYFGLVPPDTSEAPVDYVYTTTDAPLLKAAETPHVE